MKRKADGLLDGEPAFKKQKMAFTSHESDMNGNNLLHQLLTDNSTTPNQLNSILQEFSLNDASKMARSVNNQGQLPFDLIDCLQKSDLEKAQLKRLILPFMITNPFKHHRELITGDEVSKIYDYSDSKLKINLLSAVAVINEVRETIANSASHITANDLSRDQKYYHNYTTMILRQNYVDACHDNQVQHYNDNTMQFTPDARFHYRKANYSVNSDKILAEYADLNNNPTALVQLPDDLIKENLLILCEFIIKSNHANCDEYVQLGFYHFIENNIPAEKISFTVGDHVFLVIGRNPQSDLRNPLTWGESAVICDSWSGEAYPAREFSERLHSLRTIVIANDIFRIAVPFNNNFHHLGMYPSKDNLLVYAKNFLCGDKLEQTWKSLRQEIHTFHPGLFRNKRLQPSLTNGCDVNHTTTQRMGE